MPIYEYQCSKCGYELEDLHSMSAPPLTKCPNCGNNTLKKLIGTGGGLIFKGSGFYLTDYKNKPASEKKSADHSAETVKTKTETKGGSKTDSGTKSKDSKHSVKKEVKASEKESTSKKESKKS